MSKFKNYKELDIWQKAFSMSLMVFNLCKKISINPVNKVLVNQIIRSLIIGLDSFFQLTRRLACQRKC